MNGISNEDERITIHFVNGKWYKIARSVTIITAFSELVFGYFGSCFCFKAQAKQNEVQISNCEQFKLVNLAFPSRRRFF